MSTFKVLSEYNRAFALEEDEIDPPTDSQEESGSEEDMGGRGRGIGASTYDDDDSEGEIDLEEEVGGFTCSP